MNRILVLLLGIVVLFGTTGCGTYNNMVAKDERVKEAWAGVQNQYQRRADLIPNLVNTVKGAADFEKSTLESVIEARAKATQTTISPENLTPENIQKFQAAQDGLSSALSRLLVTVERYPELKANQNFLELQAQLEGTENRITVARNDFNAAVRDYNSSVRSFPANILAGIFGFEPKTPFEASQAAQTAPTVQF